MIPARRSWVMEDFDEHRLHVFVPGAMASGILISFGLLLGDAYRKAGGQRLAERRVSLTSQSTAQDVVGGPGTSLHQPAGMRGGIVYGIIAGVFLGLVAWLVPGATWNYFNPGGYIQSIAAVWAISVVAIAGFLFVGLTVSLAAPRWLPVIIALIGLGLAIRFATLATPGWALIIVLVLATATAIGVVTSSRRALRADHLPARAWPLFVSTPLTRGD